MTWLAVSINLHWGAHEVQFAPLVTIQYNIQFCVNLHPQWDFLSISYHNRECFKRNGVINYKKA